MLDLDPKPTPSVRRALPENLFDLPPAGVLAALEAASRRVESVHDGIATSLRVWGEGEPVVMLHGAFGSWRHFVRTIPALASRYQVVTVDIPGFGASQLPDLPRDIKWLCEAIAHGIDDVVGVQGRYHLVPFSFAGQVACHLVQAHTDRLATLTLLGSGGFGRFDAPPAVSLRGKRGADRDAAHRANLKSLMIHDASRIDDLAVVIQDANTREGRLDLRQVTSRFTLAERLTGTTMPITGIWGAQDQFAKGIVHLRERTLRAARPDVDFTTIEGCGHWAAYERPDEVNARLVATMSKARA